VVVVVVVVVVEVVVVVVVVVGGAFVVLLRILCIQSLSLAVNLGLMFSVSSSSMGVSSLDSGTSVVILSSCVVVSVFKVVDATVVGLTSSALVGDVVVDAEVCAMVVSSDKVVASGTASTASGAKALCCLGTACLP